MPKKHEKGAPTDAQPVSAGIVQRSTVLLVLVAILFGALLIRILFLQTAEYDRYQKKVIEQMTTQSEVLADRGNIYDVNGVAIATNITTYRVFISPSSIAEEQSEKNQNGEDIQLAELISARLSELLDVSYDFVLTEAGRTRYLDRTVKKGVSEAKADEVRAFIAEYGLQRMIYLEATDTRYYPYSTLASHVIGFAGSDGGGLYGLEYSYNTLLAGTNGRFITARDARGNEMPYEYEEYIEAEDGYDLHTTLDVYVQSALEEQVEAAYVEAGGENRAAGIVMDVNTGAILGMAVYPNFNLNSPWSLDMDSQVILDSMGYDTKSEEYSKLKQELLLRMWSNKAITESYIPGSTFKVMTAAMVLEEDEVELNEGFECAGYKNVLGHKIRCHKTKGHGALTFTQGIQQSCNPVLMTVGLRLGAEKFYNYLTAFGYAEKTGIDLPGEGSSVVAAKASFTELDLAIYSFGQNFNVTLIQQITAVASVANGGYLVTPHLMSSVTDADGNVIKSYETNVRRQVVSSEVCAAVSKILEEGVSGDGGAKNAYVAGYRIAAKTGTSEKKERECPRCDSVALPQIIDGVTKCVCTLCKYEGLLEEFPTSDDYVCSTVAYAPADDPKYAVVIIVDEPQSGVLYGSVVAAPYVAKVMETILPYLGVEAVYSENELDKLTVTVPGCINQTGSYAKKICKNQYGLEVEIIGDENDVVYKQYPEKGTVMEKTSGKIYLYTGTRGSEITVENTTVPDVTGMSAKAANQTLINAGLNIRIEGTKNYMTGTTVKVVSQSVPKGTEVPKGTVITVRFLSLEDDDRGSYS
ncbi:MAG: PASTA domain-containing protein [Clostridia bacterium]|nr:PASTA domain-containing protein [Clostridia bacterium]